MGIFLPLLLVCFWPSGARCATSVPPEDLFRQVQAKAELVVVDVRERTEFEKSHVPSSLNIPLFAIKTKEFLKSEPFVLVCQGHSYRQLSDEADTLAKPGYRISILDGGFYEWDRSGRPIEGNQLARGLPTIEAQTFVSGRAYENWLVVDIREPAKTAPDDRDFTTIRLPYENNTRRFVEKLNSVVASHSRKELLTVILCDGKGTHYQEIERQVQAAGIKNVVYLRGGFEAYQAVRQGQLADQRTKTTIKGEKSAGRTCASGCR